MVKQLQQQLMIIPLIMAMIFVPFATAEESFDTDMTCGGQAATIIGDPNSARLDGTDGDDVIVGMNENNERIEVPDGNNIVCGGLGYNAIIVRGDSNVIITSPDSSNRVYAYGPNDTCYLQQHDYQTQCEVVSYDPPQNIEIPGQTLENMTLTMSTDKPSYVLTEPIVVSGLIDPFDVDSLPINVDISRTAPDNSIVSTEQVNIIRLDGTFSFVADGDFSQPGSYLVEGRTNDGQSGQATFEIAVAADLAVGNIVILNDRTGDVITDTALIDTTNKVIVRVTNSGQSDQTISLKGTVLDADGNQVASNGATGTISPNAAASQFEIPIQLETVGALTLTVTAQVEIADIGLIETPFFTVDIPIAVTEPIVPDPTETFTMSNVRLIDTRTGQPVTSVSAGETLNVVVDFNNDQSAPQPIALEIVIEAPGTEDLILTKEQVIPSQSAPDVGLVWVPQKNGNNVITANVFDNFTDRNILAPEIGIAQQITGQSQLSNDDLTEIIAQLQEQLAALEARIAALEQG